MCLAVHLVASSGLGAALVLAPFAPTMPDAVARFAVFRAALSSGEAARVLAPPSSSMGLAGALCPRSSSSRPAAGALPPPRSLCPRSSSSRPAAGALNSTATELLAMRKERLLANAPESVELHNCAPHPEPHTAIISAPTSAPPPTTPLLCRSLTFRGEG
jgi:hypothetical protein